MNRMIGLWSDPAQLYLCSYLLKQCTIPSHWGLKYHSLISFSMLNSIFFSSLVFSDNKFQLTAVKNHKEISSLGRKLLGTEISRAVVDLLSRDTWLYASTGSSNNNKKRKASSPQKHHTNLITIGLHSAPLMNPKGIRTAIRTSTLLFPSSRSPGRSTTAVIQSTCRHWDNLWIIKLNAAHSNPCPSPHFNHLAGTSQTERLALRSHNTNVRGWLGLVGYMRASLR